VSEILIPSLEVEAGFGFRINALEDFEDQFLML
jgi:hypothetical protein